MGEEPAPYSIRGWDGGADARARERPLPSRHHNPFALPLSSSFLRRQEPRGAGCGGAERPLAQTPNPVIPAEAGIQRGGVAVRSPFALSLSKGPTSGLRCMARPAVTLLVAVALALAACTTVVSPLSAEEQRAQAIEQSLICPICPGETIDRSQVQLAKDMQAIVREQIDAGRSDAEIRQFFVDRYGERVLAAPPREGFHWLVWAAPPVGIALGLLALFWVTHLMGRRPPQPQLAAAADDDLAPYLAQVDRELSDQPVRPEPVEGRETRNAREDT